MTFIPVIAQIPPSYYSGHPQWYTGNDVMRFIEPIGGTTIHFALFFESGIFCSFSDNVKSNFGWNDSTKLDWRSRFCIFLFIVGAAVYGQGAGFHSASNLFKNDLRLTVLAAHDDQPAKALLYWMRTVWEHEISHYLYATGFVIMSAAQAWAYRNHSIVYVPTSSSVHSSLCHYRSNEVKYGRCGRAIFNQPSDSSSCEERACPHPGPPSAPARKGPLGVDTITGKENDEKDEQSNGQAHLHSRSSSFAPVHSHALAHEAPPLGRAPKAMLVLSSLGHSILMTGVAVDYPSGLLVALIFLIVFGFGVIGGNLIRLREVDPKSVQFGYFPVLHYFLLSYALTFVFVLTYIAMVGGLRSRSQASIMS